MAAELVVQRRNLPHWEAGGSTYFLTYSCAAGRFLGEKDRTAVLDNWKYWQGKRYLLHAMVVMPDHVHVLITPKASGLGSWHSLASILHTNKGYTAHLVNQAQGRCDAVWQDERYDRIIRDEAEFQEKWNYIANNAVEAGLTDCAEGYPWLYQNPDAWDDDSRTGQRPVPPRE